MIEKRVRNWWPLIAVLIFIAVWEFRASILEIYDAAIGKHETLTDEHH